ncbi:MAG: hypothetical protein ACXW61_11280 [Gemmatirosa sp.]
MTHPTLSPHCSDEALNDWIDGRLDAAARESAARHCATCAACADRLAALRRVVAAAQSAPASIAPPDAAALERAITAAIADRAHRAAPAAAATRSPTPHAPARRSFGSMPTAWRIAAGIAVVATTAGLTAVVTARLVRDAPTVPPTVPATVATAQPASRETPPDAARLAANVASLRIETDHTLDALRTAATAGDRVLAAETLRVLEQSLRTIDAAIAEADAALARDPNNAALAALLAGTYERKRELVRRGALLGSRS